MALLGTMEELLQEIRGCTLCQPVLQLGPNPVVVAHPQARIVIIGQAPGTRVHRTSIPWNDASGKRLRGWLGVDDSTFYDEKKFAIVPMGFCYPGKGKSGDLPPRPECAPRWHAPLWQKMQQVQLTLLIGQYAQRYYLGKRAQPTLTDTVSHYADYLPEYIPLPHPSPRNDFWLRRNPWFEEEVVPVLQDRVRSILDRSKEKSTSV